MSKKVKIILSCVIAVLVAMFAVGLPVGLYNKNKREQDEYAKLLSAALTYTVISEEEKTVSVGPTSRELVNELFSDKILVFPEKVTLDNGKTYTVTEIEKANFDINSVHTYGGFYKCDKLCGIVIPKTIKKIGFFTFFGCKELKSVKIESNLIKRFEARTFGLCENLKYVEIADGVDTIGNSTFADCYSLETFTVPDTVTFIASGAFCACKNLVSVVLPAGLKTLGAKTFEACKNLTTIYFKGSREQWNSMTKYTNVEVDNAEIVFDYKG